MASFLIALSFIYHPAMKNTALLLVITASLFACSKQRCPAVPVPPAEPPTVITTGIVGRWIGSVGIFREITIGKDSINLINQPPYRYLASVDTIYLHLDDNSVYSQYGYTLSKNYDTLRLYPVLRHPDAPFTYYRSK